MREIKFRYILRRIYDKEIHFKWYYLKQIEQGLSKLFDIENYEILAINQYTGLKDKNDEEIYEGDIINLDNRYIFHIEWDNDKTGFKPFNNHNILLWWGDCIESHDIEIIGNIYENPELLEKEIK